MFEGGRSSSHYVESIPDGVMQLFIDMNPSDRTMALGRLSL
jgi:hypothetical protein